MKALFEKNETGMAIGLIVLYVVINSYCLNNFGTTDYRSALITTLLSLAVLGLTVVLGKRTYYGLTKVNNVKKYLYFIPLFMIASVNLWNGLNIDNTPMELVFHAVSMLNAGFLEEIIFRGYLFRLLEKDSLKKAIIISSLTFGIGHIANLLIGADVLDTLIQMCYATTIGFLFVMIFYKSKSLVPCILTHAAINILSIFNGENKVVHYLAAAFLVVVPLLYTAYINKNVKETGIEAFG